MKFLLHYITTIYSMRAEIASALLLKVRLLLLRVFHVKHTKLKEKERVINERLSICAGCEYNSKNVEDYNSNLFYDHCVFCLCSTKLKPYCLECNCGIEEFNKKSETKLPLKWQSSPDK